MILKSVAISRLNTKNNVFLAPLAGFSTKEMRQICTELGAGLCFTEMVSAKGLKYGNQGTIELLDIAYNEEIKAVQIFGCEPDIMREACENPLIEKFDIVDINMGCPVPKVFNNGEGSALMGNISLAEKIVSECVKSGKIVTVKMRSGISKGEKTAIELAKAVENGGASLITVHGRCRDSYYSGEVDYDLIATIKKNAKIPVIANGGVFTPFDADKLIENTGADGIMLARGALFNPFLFSQITNTPTNLNKKDLIFKHIDLVLKNEEEKYAIPKLRKQLAYYLHGIKGSKQIKPELFKAETCEKVKELISSLFDNN